MSLPEKTKKLSNRTYGSTSGKKRVKRSKGLGEEQSPASIVKVNKIRNRYLVAEPNTHFSADETVLCNDDKFKLVLFFTVDLGTRLIIGHSLNGGAFSSSQIIECLEQSLIPRIEDKPRPIVFHTDSASIYTSAEFQAFADKHQITLSRSVSFPQKAYHGNQVSESLNRWIKGHLRKVILKNLKPEYPHITEENWFKKGLGPTLLVLRNSGKEHLLSQFLIETISEYNSRPHSSPNMFRCDPFGADEAFESVESPKDLPDISKNDNSVEAVSIRSFRSTVFEGFALNLIAAMVFQLQVQTNQLEAVLASQNRLEHTNAKLVDQNQRLYEINRTIEKKVEYLEAEAVETKKKELAKQVLKAKRKAAKPKAVRDAITYSEYRQIIQMVEDKPWTQVVKSRTKVGLCLLYLTGLRISNLLLLTKKHLNDLIEHGEITIPLIKSTIPSRLIAIGAAGQKELDYLKSDITLLQAGQPNLGGPIFVASKDSDSSKAISRVNLSGQINRLLQEASRKIGKHIRSHSFRATYITDLLDHEIPIEQVKDIMSHTNISTTAIYRRSKLKLKELRMVAASVNRARQKNFQVNIQTKAKKATPPEVQEEMPENNM